MITKKIALPLLTLLVLLTTSAMLSAGCCSSNKNKYQAVPQRVITHSVYFLEGEISIPEREVNLMIAALENIYTQNPHSTEHIYNWAKEGTEITEQTTIDLMERYHVFIRNFDGSENTKLKTLALHIFEEVPSEGPEEATVFDVRTIDYMIRNARALRTEVTS